MHHLLVKSLTITVIFHGCNVSILKIAGAYDNKTSYNKCKASLIPNQQKVQTVISFTEYVCAWYLYMVESSNISMYLQDMNFVK